MTTFGQALEADIRQQTKPGRGQKKMSEAQVNGKINNVLKRWLGIDSPQQFKDPSVRR